MFNLLDRFYVVLICVKKGINVRLFLVVLSKLLFTNKSIFGFIHKVNIFYYYDKNKCLTS